MCKPDRNEITNVLSNTMLEKLVAIGREITLFLSLILILASAAPSLGQQSVSVPVGTVIPLRIDKLLSSYSSRVGDTFTATVFRPVVIDGRTVLPEGAKVEGRVTGTTQGVRGKTPATIAVAFDKISLSDGKTISVDATLTALDEEARRRIEQDVRSQSGQTRRAVVFLGATGGANPTIGVPVAPAKTNSVGAIIGSVLGGGDRADVQPSTEFGMMLESAFNVEIASNPASTPSQSVLSSYESIRAAQTALRGRNYYNGPIDGVMNQSTRDAIRSFQRDRNIANTGDLDLSTARALGIPVDTGGTVGSGPVGGTGGIGDPRQIAFLADRLLQDFQRDLNISNNRGQVIFDKQRTFKPHEVEVLSQMMSLRGSADLYSQLTSSFTDRDTVKGAAVGLIRQARLLERIVRRSQMTLSSLVSSDLQQLQSELARITIIDPNDSDIVR